MAEESIAPEVADELLRRQELLQQEATSVLSDLDLFAILAPFGEVCQVGSSAVGLMMQRDIDVCVVRDALETDTVFEAARPLVSHSRVRKLNFINEAGIYKPPDLMEGLYWGVHYERDPQAPWKLDIWFWLPSSGSGDVEYATDLRRRLTPQTRLAILWIKDASMRRGVYGSAVRSIDVYDAVLSHGVRTPTAFESWLAARQVQTD